MSSSREHCYPVKALGSVTINGSIITRGETIQQFGELRIDLGTYRQDDIAVYNDAIPWSPVSIEGDVLVFNMQSNGKYFIYDNARKIVFDFSVDVGQDFFIDALYGYNQENPLIPGNLLRSGTYAQLDTRTKSSTLPLWVKSTGTGIASLDLSATNNAEVSLRTKSDEYGDDYIFFNVKFHDSVVGSPVSVYVGNVLVVYIERLTE